MRHCFNSLPENSNLNATFFLVEFVLEEESTTPEYEKVRPFEVELTV